MRGDLVAAMLYEPRILYLDEPTVGLDVLAKERIRSFIQQINRGAGTTIILTTHDLNDVERLCRRVLLIHQGRILYNGSVERLKALYAPHRVLVVHLATDHADIEVDDAEVMRREGSKVWLRFDPEQVAVAALINTVTSRYQVADLAIEEPELEGVVRQIYEQRQVRA
jgi:ABC-2 type transport system ATP-binding protein